MKQGRTVLEAKRFGIYLCHTWDSLLTVAQKMMREDVSSLVIVDDDGYLAGIITRVDLLRAYMANDTWATRQAGEYMVRDVVTVTPNDLLHDVATLLVQKQIHRAVVVQDDGDGWRRPVGIISAADLVYHMVRAEAKSPLPEPDEEDED